MNLAQDAHDYAALGWAVFPLQPGGKKPFGYTTGLHAASADLDLTLARWTGRAALPLRERKAPDERMPAKVTAGPRANIGLATGAASKVWVLDVDGEEGRASLFELAEKHGRLPATVRQVTGGGGAQLFYAWPGELPWGARIRNSASTVGAKLDVRGEGGYVVLPPSVHPSGRQYAWVEGAAPWETEPARAPWWLLRLVAPPPPPAPVRSFERRDVTPGQGYAAGALAAAVAEVEAARPGARDTTLHRNAYGIGRLVAGGELTREAAFDALMQAGLAMGAGDKEYGYAQVAWKVNHAFQRAERDPRRAP